jgi:hypothetical protein
VRNAETITSTRFIRNAAILAMATATAAVAIATLAIVWGAIVVGCAAGGASGALKMPQPIPVSKGAGATAIGRRDAAAPFHAARQRCASWRF